MMSEREFIIAAVELNTRTHGGGTSNGSLVGKSLQDGPLCFASGVNVAQVVDLVFQAKEAYPHFVEMMEREKQGLVSVGGGE